MKMQILNGRIVGEHPARARFLGPNRAVVLEEAPPQEDEETLVSDPRGNLRPSQIVEQRLTTLLSMNRPRSLLGVGGTLYDLQRAQQDAGVLPPGGAARSQIRSVN